MSDHSAFTGANMIHADLPEGMDALIIDPKSLTEVVSVSDRIVLTDEECV